MRHERVRYRWLEILCVVLLLAGFINCGGQNGSGSPAPERSTPPATTPSATEFVYVTNATSNNISAFRVNTSTGGLTAISGSPFAAGNSPQAAAVVSGKFLYTANYNAGNTGQAGNVSAYKIDATTGALAAIAGSPFAAGIGPQSLVADPGGKFLYVANFWSASVSAFTIDANSGALTPVAGSPFGSGGTYVALAIDPLGKYVYVSDNGFGRIAAFTVNPSTGALTPVSYAALNPTLGTDPLGLRVHPSGKFLYVIDWLAMYSSSLLGYSIDATSGTLTALPWSPVALTSEGNSLALDPTGKFAYFASSRTPSGPGVVAFSVDATTGMPTVIGGSPYPAEGPSGIAVDPQGKFVFVTNQYLNDVAVYIINSTTGALTTAPGAPYATGTGPTGVAVTTVP